MRPLLDENFPSDFANLIVEHQVRTVHSYGWSGIRNGELLRRANEVCDVFVTLDRNLEFQQDIKVSPFGVVVVTALFNRMVHLAPHIESIAAIYRTAPETVVKAGMKA